MNPFDATVLKARAADLPLAMRGYAPEEVNNFIHRLEAVATVFAEDHEPLPELPVGLSPYAVRIQEFSIEWRGYDMDAVRELLTNVADFIEAVLARPEPDPNAEIADSRPVLELPEGIENFWPEITASGIFTGATLVFNGNHVPLTFCTPALLAAKVAHRRGDVLAVPNLIIVPEVSELEILRAIDRLSFLGELARLLPFPE